MPHEQKSGNRFLSTLSLRRATFSGDHGHMSGDISIHALLAESDHVNASDFHFCGISIHALLAESDRVPISSGQCNLISIHALLAESDKMHALIFANPVLFLSTLSLRRATCQHLSSDFWRGYFYPRSPCGERRQSLQ